MRRYEVISFIRNDKRRTQSSGEFFIKLPYGTHTHFIQGEDHRVNFCFTTGKYLKLTQQTTSIYFPFSDLLKIMVSLKRFNCTGLFSVC